MISYNPQTQRLVKEDLETGNSNLWVSLGKGKGIDFVSELGTGGSRNMGDYVVGRERATSRASYTTLR